ncbi:MAG: hypothetical protein WBW33_34765, partial [Bryobacteraceae bacterium]
EPAAILRLLVATGMRVTAAGCSVGLLGSVAVSRLLGSLLFQVSSLDPVILSCSVIAIAGAAFGASVLPVLRVAEIEPMQALRAD